MDKTEKKSKQLQRVASTDQKVYASELFYDMKLRFRLSLEFAELNSLASLCGFKEKAIANDAATLFMSQVVPFIPDDELLQRYAEAIAENYRLSNPAVTIHSCVFDGYEHLYAVRVKNFDPTEEELVQLVTSRIKDNTIAFVEDPRTKQGTVCQIGDDPFDDWFYFTTSKHDGKTLSMTDSNDYQRWVDTGLVDIPELAKVITDALLNIRRLNPPKYRHFLKELTKEE